MKKPPLENPYASQPLPKSEADRSGPLLAVSWACLFGSVRGATAGAIGMFAAVLLQGLAELATVGPAGPDSVVLHGVAVLMLAAIVGGVGGTMTGLVAGVVLGILMPAAPRGVLIGLGAVAFAAGLGGQGLMMLWAPLIAPEPVLRGAAVVGVLLLTVLGARAGVQTVAATQRMRWRAAEPTADPESPPAADSESIAP